MKPRQFFVLILSIIMVGLGAYVALTVWWQPPPPPPPMDSAKLFSALEAFSQDRRDAALPIPASLTLRELVASGYLGTNDVRAFEGTEVTFQLDSDLTRPQEVMIRVKLRDGTQMVLLGDGSVQRVSK